MQGLSCVLSVLLTGRTIAKGQIRTYLTSFTAVMGVSLGSELSIQICISEAEILLHSISAMHYKEIQLTGS